MLPRFIMFDPLKNLFMVIYDKTMIPGTFNIVLNGTYSKNISLLYTFNIILKADENGNDTQVDGFYTTEYIEL